MAGPAADVNESNTVKTLYRGLFRFCGWLVDEDEVSESIEDLHPHRFRHTLGRTTS